MSSESDTIVELFYKYSLFADPDTRLDKRFDEHSGGPRHDTDRRASGIGHQVDCSSTVTMSRVSLAVSDGFSSQCRRRALVPWHIVESTHASCARLAAIQQLHLVGRLCRGSISARKL